MKTGKDRSSVIMEVEIFRNSDKSVALLGKDGGQSHGLAVQVVGHPGTINSHPTLYKMLAQILRDQGLSSSSIKFTCLALAVRKDHPGPEETCG